VSRRCARSAFRVLFKKLDRVTHGQDGFGGIVGDFAAELFLECHHELDGIEAVGSEVVDEAGTFGDLLGFDTQMLHDDLLNPLGNVTHRSNLVRFDWAGIRIR
jgi:hypothetical protein